MSPSSSVTRILVGGHLVALAFGLGGLLIALPHPKLWADDPRAVQVFDFGMRYAGALHIGFGAAAMLIYGMQIVGRRKTLSFFLAATTISLTAELLGTTTGLPFGNYTYSDYLGPKVLDRVPWAIPLSWFYLGFAAYLLGSTVAARCGLRPLAFWSIGLGVWFLTAWDLVLDPAMAHEAMPVKFWEWQDTGVYLGMPLKNLLGWAVTGLPFIVLSRLLWQTDIVLSRHQSVIPFVIYAANVGFAMALSASVGLWLPIVLAALLGLLPAVIGLGLLRPLPGLRARNATVARRPS